jgi:hypothetical protein
MDRCKRTVRSAVTRRPCVNPERPDLSAFLDRPRVCTRSPGELHKGPAAVPRHRCEVRDDPDLLPSASRLEEWKRLTLSYYPI